jgi:hypothetical protein
VRILESIRGSSVKRLRLRRLEKSRIISFSKLGGWNKKGGWKKTCPQGVLQTQ